MDKSTAAVAVASGISVKSYVNMKDRVIGGLNVNNEKFIENKLMAKNPSPEWEEVINIVKDKYKDTEKGNFIRMRYVEKKSPVTICMNLNICQTAYYLWRKEILNEVMLQAAYKQIFKP